MHEAFRPQERIRKKKDFLHLYKKGKRFRGKSFIFIYLSNELGYSRVAVVASKKLGNAVRRNKIKRQFRTLYRRNKILLTKPIDLIIIPHRKIHEVPWQSLEKDFLTALKSLNSRNQVR
jgi:ribonuclease P protein component